ncbi:MAG: 2-oxoacid:acceptor oxidoreductase family protein [Candidatus Omnitrophota bacterium]
MEEQIFIAGFGGQGVVLAGNLLAHAAMIEGKHILGMVSYGAEMRGGASHSFVIISNEEIDCPIIDRATIGFALSQEAYDKFRNKTRDDGILFVNSSEVLRIEPKKTSGEIVLIPASQIAKEMGNAKVANMIMIGAMLARTGILKLDSAKKALAKVFRNEKKSLLYINEQALQAHSRLNG